MYKVHVDIETFQQNGGILEQGREIFTKDDKLPIFKYAGYFLKHEEHQLIMRGGSASFPITPIAFYVQINVIPVWK